MSTAPLKESLSPRLAVEGVVSALFLAGPHEKNWGKKLPFLAGGDQ